MVEAICELCKTHFVPMHCGNNMSFLTEDLLKCSKCGMTVKSFEHCGQPCVFKE